MRVMLALAFSIVAAMRSDPDRVTATVTVAGGAHAGSFFLRNTAVPCDISAQKPPNPRHQFDVMVGGGAPNADSTKLTLLLVTIPDADLKGENHTFSTSLVFGDVQRGTRYDVESRPGHAAAGSGIVTVAMRGHDATVMLDVVASSGVAYRGTILCTDVARY
jgi:hypothetical protein